MQHWLIKFAPFRTSWSEIIARGAFTPRGIHSAEARKHLGSMRLGDHVLFYQSQQDQSIIGLLEVSKEAYPDPTSADPTWLTCDFKPLATFSHPISLKTLKNATSLRDMTILRQPRLAVMPVSQKHFEAICEISTTKH